MTNFAARHRQRCERSLSSPPARRHWLRVVASVEASAPPTIACTFSLSPSPLALLRVWRDAEERPPLLLALLRAWHDPECILARLVLFDLLTLALWPALEARYRRMLSAEVGPHEAFSALTVALFDQLNRPECLTFQAPILTLIRNTTRDALRTFRRPALEVFLHDQRATGASDTSDEMPDSTRGERDLFGPACDAEAARIEAAADAAKILRSLPPEHAELVVDTHVCDVTLAELGRAVSPEQPGRAEELRRWRQLQRVTEGLRSTFSPDV